MRKIRIIEHISLDGVIQSPGGPNEGGDDYPRGGWTAPYGSAAGAEAVVEAQGSKFDLLLGRRTYDMFASYWPKAGDSPIANGLNAATKYVATHRPDGLEWGPTAKLGADVIEGIRRVKSEEGPDIVVWGSAMLTAQLLEQQLADELVLLVYPVLLGRGKRLFEDVDDTRVFGLVSSQTLPSGVLVNKFQRVESPR